jgi:hypothetical protein
MYKQHWWCDRRKLRVFKLNKLHFTLYKLQLVLRDFLYEQAHGLSGIRDSAVSPVNMRQPGATDFRSYLKRSDGLFGRPSLVIPWVPVVKWPGREIDPSLPSSAVKNKWRYISTAPICLHGAERDMTLLPMKALWHKHIYRELRSSGLLRSEQC